jgi:hypothetical protein
MHVVTFGPSPQIVNAMVTAAREDPAPTVRAACVRCLCRMNVATDLVAETLRGLKNDPDAGVRQAAEETLARMSPAQPSAIQPVGATSGQ